MKGVAYGYLFTFCHKTAKQDTINKKMSNKEVTLLIADETKAAHFGRVEPFNCTAFVGEGQPASTDKEKQDVRASCYKSRKVWA